MSRQHHNPGQPPPPTCPALKSVALGYNRPDGTLGRLVVTFREPLMAAKGRTFPAMPTNRATCRALLLAPEVEGGGLGVAGVGAVAVLGGPPLRRPAGRMGSAGRAWAGPGARANLAAP